mgnify:CR=1 FL=1
MLSLGYTQVAKICLTHSFCNQDLSEYIGNFDITPDEQKELEIALDVAVYDDYDRLIQLCDALGAANGIVEISEFCLNFSKKISFSLYVTPCFSVPFKTVIFILSSQHMGNHSRNVAFCASKIAEACGMNKEKAYILGLLHDIGRKFGIKHLGHVYDGYKYMLSLGYTQVAKICLTHSF